MPTERLQKILARGGLASRRAAEKLITEGRVRVNGKIVTELGAKADPRHDRVEVDGKRVVAEKVVYYALHKPRGFVTTLSDPEGRPTIVDLLKRHAAASEAARLFPVGRLDFHTSGVLLVTNDGAFSDGLLHPKGSVPKTYVVKVQGVMTPDDIEKWRAGVQLEDGMTRPADAAFLRFEGDKTWFEITIREGRNQQIRRMGDATGFRVMRLSRVSFAGITVEGLRPGDMRALTREELVEMKKAYGVPRHPSAAGNAEEIAPRKRAMPVGRVVREKKEEREGARGREHEGGRGREREGARGREREGARGRERESGFGRGATPVSAGRSGGRGREVANEGARGFERPGRPTHGKAAKPGERGRDEGSAAPRGGRRGRGRSSG